MTAKQIGLDEALEILSCNDDAAMEEIFDRASELREASFQNRVSACSVINARCGGCTEDCAFCAQSAHSKAQVRLYPLVSETEILHAAKRVRRDRAAMLGIVTSGRAVARRELEQICGAVRRIVQETDTQPCASLGILDLNSLVKLKEAGLKRYHHNLETAESFFPEICRSRTYKDQIKTVRNAKEAGLEVCCGGIFGLGESIEQRHEMLDTIRRLDVDSVPLNFLNPIKGTRLEGLDELTPKDCLKIIALARIMMPSKSIRVCGGREYNIKDLQHKIFRAGADGIMIGGYLVTQGNPVEKDIQMIKNAGMEIP
ncbi:MAG: biotin synthase BioB [Victivallales bacterium]|nr:biotin synthase BioB [Victivallales bacterium]